MANSKRQVILDYLRDTTFAHITTGNGYNFTPGKRARGLEQIDALPNSSFPAIYISNADEQRENITRNQILSRMDVIIVGYVRNSSGIDDLQQDIDYLIEDISKSLEQDRTLGGNAKWLEIKSITSDDGDMKPFGVCAVGVEIVYATEGVTP